MPDLPVPAPMPNPFRLDPRRLLGETRDTAILALPLVLGQLSAVGMNVVDTLLAGRHGAHTLAGVAVGSAVWSLVILTLIGVLMALPPSVAQLNGAGRRAQIGPLFRQGLWLGGSLGLALLLLVLGSGPLLGLMGIEPDVRDAAAGFLRAIAWGAPAMGLYFVCRYLSEGLAWTPPTMVFGVGGLVLLTPLGWALMFGVGPVPAMGATGLGLATSIVLWLQCLGFLLYLRLSPRFRDLQLFGRFDAPQRAPIAELLRIGLPMGVAIFMEGSLFIATALLIARMGATAVAAHQIAINVASVCFMLPMGVAMATTVRVGHAVGRGDGPGVAFAGAAGYTITAVTQLLTASVLLVASGWIAGLYSTDAAVVALAANLMLYAAAFQLSDGLQVASAGALRGLKDTRRPMVITALSYWGVGMPLGAALGFGLGWGPQGMWWGLILGLSVAAILLTLRFARLARQHRQGMA